MWFDRILAASLVGLALAASALGAGPELTRAKALQALDAPVASIRLAGIERLAEIGKMADVDALALRLRDDDEVVRELAAAAMWQVWSRSGDPAIDKLYLRGVDQMGNDKLAEALITFSEIVRRKPGFAEGWNKRATVLFLLGRDEESLKDCDQVLKRNRHHFGALSGMAQIHLRRDDPERALAAWQRALQINPNLGNGAAVLQLLEEAAQQRRGQRT